MRIFRNDINGLRAIAVIAVVIYHFNPAWLPGGFAGVDVFFVISGFLMTGIIVRGISDQSFSLMRFYIARVNRIIPALAVLCIALLILGWFVLAPRDFRTLGSHAASSMAFVSNMLYWLESGYFDAASHEKWLLHTWSLSVEWQFYVLYPVVLLAIHRLFGLRGIKVGVLAMTLLSFAICVAATIDSPTSAFYFLHYRLWELTVGGLAFLFPLRLAKSQRIWLESAGIVLILASYILVSNDDLWPGYLAALPVLGTFLVIQAARNDSMLTGNGVFQKIGLWSYSIYLWHWPVVVALNYLGFRTQLHILMGAAASFLLGYASYSLVENRRLFRLKDAGGLRLMRLSPLAGAFIVASLGTIVYLQDGYKHRQDSRLQLLAEKMVMQNRHNGYCFYNFHSSGIVNEVSASEGTSCVLGDAGEEPSMLLFGDSYAGHYEPFWDQIYKEAGQSFNAITTNWCYPSFNENFSGPKSNDAYKQCLLNRQHIQKEMQNYKAIVLAAAWGEVYEQGLMDDIKTVVEYATSNGISVFIMASPTSYDTDIAKRFMSSVFNGVFDMSTADMPRESDKIAREANEALSRYASRERNVIFIERDALFDSSDLFFEYGLAVPYSLDGKHISMIGSKQAAAFFANRDEYRQIEELLFDEGAGSDLIN